MKFAAIAASAVVLAALADAQTPAPTTTASSYDEDLGCWPISVEHDATYCIEGPICSGSGAEPAGWLCPVAGDKAIADCHSYLVSYEDGDDCTLPVDATCEVIHTGAWGCVLSSSTPSPTTPSSNSTDGSSAGSNSTSEDISFSSVATAASAGSVSAGAIAAIAAAAAVVCAVVGTVLYRKYQKKPEPSVHEQMVDVVTP